MQNDKSLVIDMTLCETMKNSVSNYEQLHLFISPQY